MPGWWILCHKAAFVEQPPRTLCDSFVGWHEHTLLHHATMIALFSEEGDMDAARSRVFRIAPWCGKGVERAELSSSR